MISQLSPNSIGINLIINTKACGFECTESHFSLIYKLGEIINNSRYCVKNGRYDQNGIISKIYTNVDIYTKQHILI